MKTNKKLNRIIEIIKKPQIILVLVFAIVGVAALIISKAATPTASLTLSPATGTYNKDATITVGVYEDSGITPVSAVDFGLVYNTAKLQYLSTDTTGSQFSPVAAPTASGGVLVMTNFINPGTVTAGNVTGRQLIANVSFKVLVGTGSTSITFLKEPVTSSSKSAVYQYQTTTNIWDGVNTGGTYTLTVPDTTGPVVTNSTPANGATVNGTVNVVSTITDDRGVVSNAKLYINGSATGLAMTAGANNTYSYSWNTTSGADGPYTLVVKATDPAGNETTDTTRTVNVLNAKPDLVVLSVILSPAAPVAGDNVTITSVIKNQGALNTAAGAANVTGFTMDGTSIGVPSNTTSIAVGGSITVTSPWTATAGNHSLVVAADKNNVISESNETNNSNTKAFSVAVPDTTAPTYSGATSFSQSTSQLIGNVTLTSNVTDSGSGMAKVEFFVDNVLKSTDTSSPFTYIWNTTTIGDGAHSVYTKAYDVAGNVATSTTSNVTVKNIPTPGDANRDDLINMTDLLAVLNHWQLASQTRLNGELTGDTSVNIQDLLQVLNNWSK